MQTNSKSDLVNQEHFECQIQTSIKQYWRKQLTEKARLNNLLNGQRIWDYCFYRIIMQIIGAVLGCKKEYMCISSGNIYKEG